MIPELTQDERCETGHRARMAILEALSELGGESRRQPLLAKAAAEGGFTERELAAPAPADTRARYANNVSYQLAHALHQLTRDGLVQSPAWNVWSLTAESHAPAPLTVVDVAAERRRELREMPYHLYLRTPEWHALRATALTRPNLCCALDRSHTEHLEVHHTRVDRLGEERPSDLIVLCRGCHEAHHHVGGPMTGADAEARRAAASIPPPVSVAVGSAPVAAAPEAPRRRRRLFGG